MNNDSNVMRVFSCGCAVEWRLDRIKFTECEMHSDKGEVLEATAVDKITITG